MLTQISILSPFISDISVDVVDLVFVSFKYSWSRASIALILFFGLICSIFSSNVRTFYGIYGKLPFNDFYSFEGKFMLE